MNGPKSLFFVSAGLLGLALLLPRPAAAWPSDPLVNLPICDATDVETLPKIVSDGAGGAIVTWTDTRSGDWTTTDIYVQKISIGGTCQWKYNGVPLCTAPGDQGNPAILPDGAGGAIVTWEDFRNDDGTWSNSNIYAQRISAEGVPQWTTDGVPLCTATGLQWIPAIVADGTGGAIITWSDARSGPGNIYAQRISANGVPQWTTDGVPLSTASCVYYGSTIVSDGAGGAIVTWTDARSDTADIYAQRISANGTPQWTTDGVPLCTAPGWQQNPKIVSDGTGGAIVTWDGWSSGSDRIYAQRLAAEGVPQWTTDGVPLCAATGWQEQPDIISDGAGGAIVTWFDSRSGTSYDVYAQRISAGGMVQWTATGLVVCTADGDKFKPKIISDGAGGAIITWMDARSRYFDLYAQKLSAAGTPQWPLDGVVLSTAEGDKQNPAIVSDGTGGAIVTWDDYRYYNAEVYAQRVCASGQLGDCSGVDVSGEARLVFALDPVRPNPSRGGALTVNFSLPTDAPARLELLDVAGRRIASHDVGAGLHTFDLGQGQHLAPGLYLVRLTQGMNTRTTRVAVLR